MLKGGVTCVQCTHGLHHRDHSDVELWCGGDGVHSLEGPTALTTNVPHHDLSPNGTHLHQVLARLDSVDGAWRYGCLG